MKRVVKPVAERLLIASGIAAAKRRALHGKTLILAYHNIVPDGETARGDLSLHLPQRRFAEQLDRLASVGDVVPLSDVDAPNPRGRSRFVITFDDAYAGALTAGVAELKQRGLPATVFVAPALLGGTTWWDTLADPALGAVRPDLRDHALAEFAGRGTDVLAWASREATPLADAADLPKIGTIDDVRTSLAYDGLSIGSHTWSHANLSTLDGPALNHELRAPHEWLRAELGNRYVPWISYPYGLRDGGVEQAARDAGYVGGLRVEGGWMRQPSPSRFAVPRYNVPCGLSANGFVLRLSGIGA